MYHHIYREADVVVFDVARQFKFEGMSTCAGKFVGCDLL